MAEIATRSHDACGACDRPDSTCPDVLGVTLVGTPFEDRLCPAVKTVIGVGKIKASLSSTVRSHPYWSHEEGLMSL